jgi:predicted ATPase/class 3 adenylate cyclase
MGDLPTGTVTFLFTDIEGSTRLVQELRDLYVDVLADYRRLLRTAVEGNYGREVDSQGDACFIAFPRARDALAAAVAAQKAITAHPWPEKTALCVRMGLHTGEAWTAGTEYVGIDVHRAARICAVGYGGQILLSQTTRNLIAERLPEGVTLRDLGKHRLKDLASPEHLFQVNVPSLPADFPPLRSLAALPNNLPPQFTNFIGRKREMSEVKQLLSMSHLVTLTGAGGAGKTRLALQVAADVLELYEDGVWLVELAALSDRALVPKAVALALSVREEPGRPLIATLTDFARPKALLLILDNCEHLLPDSANLVEALLRNCPHLRVLATSREALGIPGEVLWRVPSLGLPDPLHSESLEQLMRSDAVCLFLDRAALSQPGVAATSSNVDAIVQVCTRLDGIPLAIELAAARVQVLAVDQIAARLDDRFRLLVRGSRTGLARQQTLRATMDWSYELLTDSERAVLRQSSVFVGGWTLEAAEKVCAGQQVQSADVLDLLAQLATKSLIIVDTEGKEARYRQLETVRHYARDRLQESGEAASIRERHRDWYLALGECAAPELVGGRQAAWLDRLEIEHDNLRAALNWSVERGEAEAGLRLAGAIWRFWLMRGYLAEGRRWLETLLKMSSGVPAIVRANALWGAGDLVVFGQGDYAPGRLFYEESLALWREVGDKRGIAKLLNSLGVLAGNLGDQGTARARHEESLSIRREWGDQREIAVSLNNLGRVAYRQGDFATARPRFIESLAMWRDTGDEQSITVALINLGAVATHEGDNTSARTLLEEGLDIQQRLADKRQIAYLLEAFACLASAEGQPKRAARLFAAAEALRERIGARLPPADRPDYDHWITAAQRKLDKDAFEAASARGRVMTVEEAISEARTDAAQDTSYH